MLHDENTPQESLPSVQTNAENSISWVYQWLRWSLLDTWIFIWLLPTCSRSDKPVWSPNGKQIAFICNENSLYIANANGNWWSNLSNSIGSGYESLAWAPGDQILFSVFHVEIDNSDLYSINIDGTGLKNLTENLHDNSIDSAVWSPDGLRIAFDSGNGFNDIYVMNADGSNLKNLTESSAGSFFNPTWSPNSQQIAFYDYQTNQIDLINADGSDLKKIIPYDHEALVWSPVDQVLAISSGNGIEVINVDGSGLKIVGHAFDTSPSWSPDGQQIALVSKNAIYVMNSDGKNRRKLSEIDGKAGDLAWSPDGRQIAFYFQHCCNPFGNYDSNEIYVINANGTNLHKLNLPPYKWVVLFFVFQTILVIRLRSPFPYVRRHAQQAIILAGLNTLVMTVWLWLTRFDNPLLVGSLFLVSVFLWHFGSSWGMRQVKNGDCWLMRIRGEEKELRHL